MSDFKKRLARALQSVATDELGGEPAYQTCANIVEVSLPKPGEHKGLEERACELFEENRAALIESVVRKRERRTA